MKNQLISLRNELLTTANKLGKIIEQHEKSTLIQDLLTVNRELALLAGRLGVIAINANNS